MKRLLTVFLAACLMISAVAPAVYATEVDTPTQTTESTQETTLAENSETTETSEETSETAETSEETSETAETSEETSETAETSEGTSETTEGSKATETSESVTTKEEDKVAGEEPVGPKVPELQKTEETKLTSAMKSSGAAQELSVKDYAAFITNLKVLEGYAESYAASKKKDAKLLVLNYIRTGVEKYTSSSWQTMAGAEETDFVNYVAEQDTANGTTAAGLRNVSKFNTPNGQLVEFDHMFGSMNMSWYNANNADVGGWAGDLSDLLFESKTGGAGEIADFEEMVKEVGTVYLGTDRDDISGFGILDIYGDLDSFYLISKMKEGVALSAAMEAYFTAELTDSDRATYFLNNRFAGVLTNEDVRNAIYDSYKNNLGCKLLDADNGITEADEDLKKACCYAFADYLFELAEGRLTGPTEPGPEDPTDPTDPTEPEEPGDNPYYSVFSSTTSNLAPGITQTIKYAYTADNKQIAYYLADVDVTRDDVTIMAGYRDADPSKGWGMQRVADQANALKAKHSDPEDAENYIENFRPIVATNGAGFNMSTGEPSGLLVMNGKEWHSVDGNGFFAILKDGSAKIGTKADYATYKDQIQEAIAGFGSTLVKNGEISVSATSNYYTDRASRTAIGIKANGAVVMMVLDGRQEPFSAGGSMIEIAQIMLDAGCVEAINLDGGGSTTFVAKPEGSDNVAVVNRPSDGYQRSVSTSLIAVSTAKTSNAFSHVNISSEYEYLTIGTSLELSAVGVSESGGAAAIPEGAVWTVSDETIGTITAEGVFTAEDFGDVEVQLVADGEVLGSKTLHVVSPDEIAFEKDVMNVICGVPTEIPVKLTYNGNAVAYNANDVELVPEYDEGGSFEGLVFTGNEETTLRVMPIYAVLLPDAELIDIMNVNLYKSGEAVFEFDDATAGNRKLAWTRDVSNSTLEENTTHHVVDPTQEMELTYTFGLDMEAIEIPEELSALVSMLPGGDIEGTTAWQFLLQLAERVSDLTYVKVIAQFDKDLDVDISGLTLANEYFDMKSAELDETTNTLTIYANWVRQYHAIDLTTANPICILSGIKAKVKNGATWDSKQIINSGDVTYDIYLRASQLYSMSSLPENQEKYGLYPFVNENYIHGGGPEKGAHFADTYATFADAFTWDRTNRNGWFSYDDRMFYYVNNEALTGIQYLPGQEDAANKYFYEFAEDGSCLGAVTGLAEMDGELYYAINGAPKTGWVSIAQGTNVNYYYFHPTTLKAVDGTQKIDGYTYTFTDHVLTKGQLVTNSTGIRYMWAGTWATQEWLDLDGKIAYARSNGYFAVGFQYRYSPEGDWTYYAFDDDGWLMTEINGIYERDGKAYLIHEGIITEYPGLFEQDGAYYYISSNNILIKNRQYWISKTNGYVPEGSYWFDADGKMTLPNQPEQPDPEQPTDPTDPEQPIDPEPVKNGFVEENGDLWYYVNGVRNYAGLLFIDGDYYYVNTAGQVKRDCTYWITKTNGYLPEGSYTFGPDGKMIIETEEPEDPDAPVPEKKNGIVEEDGKLWYYVDDVKVYAGLIQIGDYYYYVRTSGELARSCNYWTTKNNGIFKSAMYTFDDQGRITNPPSVEPEQPDLPGDTAKNGIIEEDGKLWYYYNGVKTYAGVIKQDGAYYYVNTSGEVKRSCTYWITKTNDLLPERSYTFGADGKILDAPVDEPEDPENPAPAVKNGIVAERGSLYYYEEGKLVYAGLIYLDGYYYYVRTSGELAHDCKYWPTKDNGHFQVTRQYTFDSQGRMVDPPV